jgi:hypothetical protein
MTISANGKSLKNRAICERENGRGAVGRKKWRQR